MKVLQKVAATVSFSEDEMKFLLEKLKGKKARFTEGPEKKRFQGCENVVVRSPW